MINSFSSQAPAQNRNNELADKSELYLFLQNALVNPVDKPNLPRVLLIGDSISLGYTVPVRKLLLGKANVYRVPDNARNAAYGLSKIDEWLGKKPWDVISFNWGLWDICYRNPEAKTQGHRDKVHGAITASPEAYREALKAIVRKLKQTGAKLIWCSTTPVPQGEVGRIKGDEVKYNRIAAEIMRKNNIAVNDLYAYILPRQANFQLKKGNVHFNPKGYDYLALQVAAEIERALKK